MSNNLQNPENAYKPHKRDSGSVEFTLLILNVKLVVEETLQNLVRS